MVSGRQTNNNGSRSKKRYDAPSLGIHYRTKRRRNNIYGSKGTTKCESCRNQKNQGINPQPNLCWWQCNFDMSMPDERCKKCVQLNKYGCVKLHPKGRRSSTPIIDRSLDSSCSEYRSPPLGCQEAEEQLLENRAKGSDANLSNLQGSNEVVFPDEEHCRELWDGSFLELTTVFPPDLNWDGFLYQDWPLHDNYWSEQNSEGDS